MEIENREDVQASRIEELLVQRETQLMLKGLEIDNTPETPVEDNSKELDLQERIKDKEIKSKESIAEKDRLSKERIAQLQEETKERIAKLRPKPTSNSIKK